MMNINSPKITVQKTQEELYAFLTDVANFEAILPDDLETFHAKDDSFKFALKGMPAIRLAFVEKRPFELVKLKATADNLPIFLSCTIKPFDEKQSEAQLFIEADINPMMAMMLKKPLQKLLNTLAEKMQKL